MIVGAGGRVLLDPLHLALGIRLAVIAGVLLLGLAIPRIVVRWLQQTSEPVRKRRVADIAIVTVLGTIASSLG